MASGLALWLPPVLAFVFLAGFAAVLWYRQQKSTKDKGGDTTAHSERIYKSFEFFVTISLAIVGGLGYVRLELFKGQEHVARQAMFGLGLLALVVSFFISLFVIIHQGSKLRRWKDVEWEKWPFWLEFWMAIAVMTVGSLIWFAANVW